jgi:glycosyltransferase involved in cell wall biosynthesis
MVKKMFKVIDKYNIQTINAHWALPSTLLAVLTKRIHGLPVMATLYGVELFIVQRRYFMLKPFLKKAVLDSDSVIAISEGTQNIGCKMTGRKDIKIIPDGVDTDYFSPANDGNEIRERFNLNGYYIILACGRLVERKGFEYLIKAMPHIIEEIPNTRLIQIGEGPEKTKLIELVSNLGVSENVMFAGVVSNEDLAKYYAVCDCFVLPSIVDSRGDTEGSGTTLLEAMSSGKPVVGTNVGGIPYALCDGEGGFLIEQKNFSELAKKIIVLLKSKNLREEFGKKGREVVEKRFSWDKIAKKYLEEFGRLMKVKIQ